MLDLNFHFQFLKIIMKLINKIFIKYNFIIQAFQIEVLSLKKKIEIIVKYINLIMIIKI